MSGLEPSYTNIIKQELEINDLTRALAAVTGKLERLQQFVNASHCGQEIAKLREQLEAQSITYQDNLTEIQMLKAALEQIYTIVHEGYGTGNDRCEVIIKNALAPVTYQEQAETEHIGGPCTAQKEHHHG
jgi:hypothetical protein